MRHLFKVEDGFINGVQFCLFGGGSEAFSTAGVFERLYVADFGMMFVLKEGIQEVTRALAGCR